MTQLTRHFMQYKWHHDALKRSTQYQTFIIKKYFFVFPTIFHIFSCTHYKVVGIKNHQELIQMCWLFNGLSHVRTGDNVLDCNVYPIYIPFRLYCNEWMYVCIRYVQLFQNACYIPFILYFIHQIDLNYFSLRFFIFVLFCSFVRSFFFLAMTVFICYKY